MKVAIITARGGSKRIPRKNIKVFCGKPILVYSIEAALESSIFDEVMVSTDDDEIAQIAQNCGAKLPFMRSRDTSDDNAMTIDVMLEVIEEYKKMGIDIDTACCIYPTAPFITAEKLKEADSILENTDADAVIPVVRFSYPPQRCFIKAGEFIKYKWKNYELSRSQDLEPWYHDAGQFYFIRTKIMISENTMVPKNTFPYVVNEMEVQDIDNIDDWNIAELKYKRMVEKDE